MLMLLPSPNARFMAEGNSSNGNRFAFRNDFSLQQRPKEAMKVLAKQLVWVEACERLH